MEPVVTPLTPDAKAAWIEFYNKHAEEQIELSGDLSAAWSKLEGYAARLALVIHYVRWAALDPTLANPDAIDRASISSGVTLSRWFGHEARRTYAMLGEDKEDRDRRRLVELIERKGGSISVRDWQRARSHRLSTEAVSELKMLEAAGYGELRPARQSGGGRPSNVFTLFPDGTDNDNNPDAGAEWSVLSVSEASDADRKREELS